MKKIIRQSTTMFVGRTAVAIMIFASLVAALVGPFGTYGSMSFAVRLGYWATIVVTSNMLATTIWFSVNHLLANKPMLVRAAAGAAVVAVVFAPVVGLIGPSFGAPIELSSPYGQVMLSIFLVTLGINIMVETWQNQQRSTMPKLAKHLEGVLASDIRHVTVNDHYVQVSTRQGKQRLLMRFSDVLAELEGMDGFQVHRSHWVAREAIERIERRGAKSVLMLDCGREIPVSRGFIANVQFALAKHEPTAARLN